MPDLHDLEQAVGYEFADRILLQRALRHRSWCAEHEGTASNERLEFLGDAVLGWAIADMVYNRYDDDEGRLTDLRKAVVNAAALAEIAMEIGIGPHIQLGKGEAADGGAAKPSILSDAFEALLGAVYLDGGSLAAFEMVDRHVAPHLVTPIDRDDRLDHKTVLQERCVQSGLGVPRYDLTSTGPDHAKTFIATVLIQEKERGKGTGRSKRAAEQVAASAAFTALHDDTFPAPDAIA